MDSIPDLMSNAWAHLTAATPLPDPRAIVSAVLAGVLAVMWPRTWHAGYKLITIAHEGGHALAAVVTRRNVLGVRVNADGSGTTHSWGKGTGFAVTLVAFSGYPFPAVVGAWLIYAAVSGDARQWAAATAFALAMLWWCTRNLHGWLLIGACMAGVVAAAWYLPGEVLAVGMGFLGAFLLVGAARGLLQERRARRAGAMDSDVAQLGNGGRLPSGAWWAVMAAVVLGCGWMAWGQLAGVYPGL